MAAVPLESIASFVLDDALNGIHGTNRACGEPCQIAAETDVAAIWVWLNEFRDSIQTFRAYRGEVERFYNWLLWSRNIPLSSAKREDMQAYEDFLRDPQPANLWISQKTTRRNTPEWRPFKGPLAPESRAQAMTVIGALLNYLVQVRYLAGNPVAAHRRKRRDVEKREVTQKSLSVQSVQMLIAVLKSEADSIPTREFKARAHVERMLFIVRFLANTGLRREEIGTIAMSDVFTEHNPQAAKDYWYLRVTGKGNKTRIIALNDSARDALVRYRRFYGTPETYRGNLSMILLPLVCDRAGSKKVVSGQSVYVAVIDAVRFAANALDVEHPEIAKTLQVATPHWFRHTFATACLSLGHPLKLVQEQLGHESIETTAIYQHASRFAMYEAFNNLVI